MKLPRDTGSLWDTWRYPGTEIPEDQQSRDRVSGFSLLPDSQCWSNFRPQDRTPGTHGPLARDNTQPHTFRSYLRDANTEQQI